MTHFRHLCVACRPKMEAEVIDRHGTGHVTFSWTPYAPSAQVCARCFSTLTGGDGRRLVTRQQPVAGKLEWTV